MKSRIRWKVARSQSSLEEGDELGEVEVPDGLTRLIPVDLILDGVVEAEEVRLVLAGAMTSDGSPFWMAFPLPEVDGHATIRGVEADVAVPGHGCWIKMFSAGRLQRKEFRCHSKKAHTGDDKEASHVATAFVDAVVDEVLHVGSPKTMKSPTWAAFAAAADDLLDGGFDGLK